MTMIEGHIAIEPPEGVEVWDIDPYDEALLRDPYAYYAELIARGPFVYVPKYSMLAVGRYEETREVFGDWARFVSSRGVGLDDFRHAKAWRPPSIILEVDPPDHTRTRRVMARAMSPRAAAGNMEMFVETAERMVDALLEQGEFDGVGDFAEAFPAEVFPRAVGMKDSDRRALVDYGAMVFNSIGPDNALRRATAAKAPKIVPWIMAACARERLTDDGMGADVYGAADAGDITHDEAGLLIRSFLSAGVDTTVTGIGNALWCLARNPGEYERLRGDPGLARPCFEEVMRMTSPVHSFCRTAAGETEVSGVTIAADSKVLCVLGAANMDPGKWGDPEVFRIDRKPVGHLAFGVGAHGCVGQNIARAELDAVLSVLAQKVARIELTGTPVWRPNNAIHALDRMPMRFHPA